MLNAALSLPADPRSAALARRFVGDTLAAWDAGGFVWDATTVVSELATNAVLHARTDFTVSLRLGDDVLRVEVADASPRPPMPRDYGADATTGRGLALLGSLSQAHGFEPAADGKTVWCEIVPPAPDHHAPRRPDVVVTARESAAGAASLRAARHPRGQVGNRPPSRPSRATGRTAA